MPKPTSQAPRGPEGPQGRNDFGMVKPGPRVYCNACGKDIPKEHWGLLCGCEEPR